MDIPDPEELLPTVEVANFTGAQPFKLVMVGEKSSLAEVLGPVAASYKADLYLPTGEISDTLIYRMAQIGAADGRPSSTTVAGRVPCGRVWPMVTSSAPTPLLVRISVR